MTRILAALLLIAIGAGATAQEKQGQMGQGQQVYEKWCAPCHAPGNHYPGTLALRAKYRGALPDALVERRDLNPELIKYYVRNGVSVMPFFRKTEITDPELEALADFLANAAKQK